MRELIVDSFAGGGGASLGIKKAIGREPDIAINHDAAAIEMHAANHPGTKHYTEDVWKVNPRKATGGRPVGLMWLSPDCKHFSRAKGAKPVEKKIRSLAWVTHKWAAQVKPRIIILENVREFEDWGPLVPRWKCLECDWRGTEGQAKLTRRNIRNCPHCESIDIHRTDELVPDPGRKGLTFKRFVGKLRAFGYAVEWRTMNAADYGAPTHRRRLFLVARRDGKPIVWPDPTHGDPKKIGKAGKKLKPWRTAAECIDWSIPCPSIFDRKKPLAEKTLRRIALGIKRYVLENPEPFIVGIGGPAYSGEPRPTSKPMGAVMPKNSSAVVAPFVAKINHSDPTFRGSKADEPMDTLTAKRGQAIIAPYLASIGQTGGNGARVNGVEEPIRTVVSKNEHLLVAPTLIQTGYGERKGQKPRTLDLNKPAGTVVAGGCKQAIAAAFLAKHFGGQVGVPIETPMPTTTARGTQNQLAIANLIHFNHGAKQWSGVDEPMRTQTTNNHARLVYTFLTKYFGQGVGQSAGEPLHTITSKDRFGLVLVDVKGQPHVIVDIGMRMFTPRELAICQGFDRNYILTGSKTSQVARIGNSVSPENAEALVRANYNAKLGNYHARKPSR